MPAISLIMPVYNPGPRLARALESVSSQTFDDYELITVDDGSTDGSLETLTDYARVNPRVKIITRPNGGASAARNTGLDASTGKWIVFADADDVMLPDYLRGLIDDATSAPDVDMVIQGIVWHGEDHDSTLAVAQSSVEEVTEAFRAQWMDMPLIHLTAPYSKLISRDMIERSRLRFNTSIRKLEDFEYLTRLIAASKRVKMSTTVNYIYDYHDGSLSRTIYSVDSEIQDMEILLDAFKVLAPEEKITDHFEAHDVFQRGIRRIYAANNYRRYSRSERARNLRLIPERQLRLFREYPGGNMLLRFLRSLSSLKDGRLRHPVLLDIANQILFRLRWSRQQKFA